MPRRKTRGCTSFTRVPLKDLRSRELAAAAKASAVTFAAAGETAAAAASAGGSSSEGTTNSSALDLQKRCACLQVCRANIRLLKGTRSSSALDHGSCSLQNAELYSAQHTKPPQSQGQHSHRQQVQAIGPHCWLGLYAGALRLHLMQLQHPAAPISGLLHWPENCLLLPCATAQLPQSDTTSWLASFPHIQAAALVQGQQADWLQLPNASALPHPEQVFPHQPMLPSLMQG